MIFALVMASTAALLAFLFVGVFIMERVDRRFGDPWGVAALFLYLGAVVGIVVQVLFEMRA